MTTAWNPSDQGGGIAFSNSNKTATGTAFAFAGVRATTSKLNTDTGKYYFELHCNGSFSDNRSFLGMIGNTTGLGSQWNNTGYAGIPENGLSMTDASSSGGTKTTAFGNFNNQTFGFAVDFGNKRLWITNDGVNWNAGGGSNPSTGAVPSTWNSFNQNGGTSMLIGTTIIDTGAAVTVNASGTPAFAYTVPTGFTAWDGPTSPSGTWASTEAPDTMTATGTGPLAGTWASTDTPDVMTATGVRPGTWNSTEAPDILFATGYVPIKGTLAATGAPDTWATNIGFDNLDIDTSGVLDGSGIHTTGYDRLIFIAIAGCGAGVEAPSPSIVNGVTDSAGLTWHQRSTLVGGGSNLSGFLQIWWAYSHLPLTGDSVTLTNVAGSSSNEMVCWFTVKGLNADFDAPFATNDNPYAHANGLSGFLDNANADGVPRNSTAISTGKQGTSPGSFADFDTTMDVTLSSGDLGATNIGGTAAFAGSSVTKTVGKYHIEAKFDHIAGTWYGFSIFGNAGPISSAYATSNTGAITVRGDGDIYVGALKLGTTGVVPANGDWISIDFDADLQKLWARNITQNGHYNGSLQANPAAAAGGLSTFALLPNIMEVWAQPLTGGDSGFGAYEFNTGPVAGNLYQPFVNVSGSGAEITVNFGQLPFQGAVPNGFHSGWPLNTDTSPTQLYKALIFSVTSIEGISNWVDAGLSPAAGYKTIFGKHVSTTQREMFMLMQYKIATNAIPLSDGDFVVGPQPGPNWMQLTDAVHGSANAPGTMITVENPDVMTLHGYAGAFGVVGQFVTTDTPDVAHMVGFEADTGVFVTTDTPDTFSAFGFQPITGHLTATGTPDRFAATGVGRGEDGIWQSNEAVDTLTMFGYTPNSGTFVTTETPDRFSATGAGVIRVRQRRVVFVT